MWYGPWSLIVENIGTYIMGFYWIMDEIHCYRNIKIKPQGTTLSILPNNYFPSYGKDSSKGSKRDGYAIIFIPINRERTSELE